MLIEDPEQTRAFRSIASPREIGVVEEDVVVSEGRNCVLMLLDATTFF